jgi:hypothetical protein
MLRSSMLRASRSVVPSARQQLVARRTPPAVYHPIVCQQQTRAAHAISNPELANIEQRWEAMPPQEQADLWMALRDRMKAPWNELTIQEKKAGMSTLSFVTVACHTFSGLFRSSMVAADENVLKLAQPQVSLRVCIVNI